MTVIVSILVMVAATKKQKVQYTLTEKSDAPLQNYHKKIPTRCISGERDGERRRERARGRETDRQIDRQAGRQAGRQTDRQTVTDSQTERDRQTETDRQAGRQAGRQTDSDRQSDRDRQRQTDRDRKGVIRTHKTRSSQTQLTSKNHFSLEETDCQGAAPKKFAKGAVKMRSAGPTLLLIRGAVIISKGYSSISTGV